MKKNILACLFLVIVFVLMAAPLAAQTGGVTFDPGTVDLILLGVAGLTVVGITQMVKVWLKASGALAYVISGAVSAAATAYYLVKADQFTVIAFVGYTVFVFLAANGIYKAKAT